MMPTDAYLAAINAGLADPNALAANALGVSPTPPGALAPSPAAAPPPSFVDQAGAALGAPAGPTIDNSALATTPFTTTPPTPPAPPPPPPPAAGPPGPPGTPVGAPGPLTPPLGAPLEPSRVEFPLRAVSTPGRPAHEVEMRGPTLLGAQANAHQAETDAALDNAGRTVGVSMEEHDYLKKQAETLVAKNQADEAAIAKGQDEKAQAQAEFNDATQQLAKAGNMDPGHWWASRTGGQKALAMASLFLGGFMQGFRGGGPNPAMDVINRYVDNDIRAQEFAYGAARDKVNAKQTAFSMAMQKWGNPDVARAAARKTMMDGIQMNVAALAAKHKGIDAQNYAQSLLAEIEREKAADVAKGVAYLQASGPGMMFVDPRTGVRYTNKEAQGVSSQVDKENEARNTQATGVAGQLMVEGAKAGTAKAAQERGMAVRLPTGEIHVAETNAEADNLRRLSTNVDEMRALAKEAHDIRSRNEFRVPMSQDRVRLGQLQERLVGIIGRQEEMHAMNPEEAKRARRESAALFDVGPGPDHALDMMTKDAEQRLMSRVKTSPNAPARAAGKMPASFTAHGGK